MSASDTKIEKQTRRHRPALVGIAVAVASALVVAFAFGVFGFGPGTDEASSGEPAIGTAPLISN